MKNMTIGELGDILRSKGLTLYAQHSGSFWVATLGLKASCPPSIWQGMDEDLGEAIHLASLDALTDIGGRITG